MTRIFGINFPIVRSRKALIIFAAFDRCISDQIKPIKAARAAAIAANRAGSPLVIASAHPPYEFGVKVPALDAAKPT